MVDKYFVSLSSSLPLLTFEDPSDLILVLPVGDIFRLNQRPVSPRGQSMPRKPDFLFSASSSSKQDNDSGDKEGGGGQRDDVAGLNSELS